MHRHRVVVDGAVAGMLGAITVALWFLLVDLTRGVPFETPTLLAAVLLHGKTVVVGPQLRFIVEYTVLHFAAFLLFGIAAAILIEAAERERSLIISLLIFLFSFAGPVDSEPPKHRRRGAERRAVTEGKRPTREERQLRMERAAPLTARRALP